MESKGVCSAHVLKALLRLRQKLSTHKHKTFWANPYPKRWFGVRVGPFYPYEKPVLHSNEMVLFDNLSQPVSWGSDVRVYAFPGEQESWRVLLWSFWRDRPQRKQGASRVAEPATLCAKLPNEEGDFFSFYVSPIAAKELLSGIACSPLSLMPCSWQLLAAAAACPCRLLTDGSVSALAPHTQPAASAALEGQLSCTLAFSTQLGRSFLHFLRIIRKMRRESLCGL